jgi:hypothetical protein
MEKTYEKDKDGSIVDPPVISDYEKRLQAAHDEADDSEIQRIQEEYVKARQEKVNRDKPRSNTAKKEKR